MPAPPDPIRVPPPPRERTGPPPPPRARAPRGPRERAASRRRLGALAAVLFLATLPVTGAVAAYAVASALGCRVSEAGPQPCAVAGVDVGGALAPWGVAPWLAFVTVPAGALVLAVVGAAGGRRVRAARREDREASGVRR